MPQPKRLSFMQSLTNPAGCGHGAGSVLGRVHWPGASLAHPAFLTTCCGGQQSVGSAFLSQPGAAGTEAERGLQSAARREFEDSMKRFNAMRRPSVAAE